MLEVENVNWHLLENAKAHHTDRYEVVHEESTPVFRRAQPFKLTVTFKNRPFNETKDNVRLFFLHGSKKLTPRLQSAIDNTTVTLINKINDSTEQWSLELVGQEKNSITVLVRGPSNAPWGIWNLHIKCSLKTFAKTTIWKSATEFYLVYNPWCKDDEVFMPDTRFLDEFILNDIGKLYTSSAVKPIGMKWIYGQFASSVIKVVRKLLSTDEIKEDDLSSPTRLCRFLARNIGNIVYGNWSGDYSDGTPPWLWTGSIPIYDEYLKTEIPVKYGQCFIYSGVFTTALRAVGIPARSVTNFISASGGSNMAVNNIFDKDGNLIKSDSIWNFHVWNDVWMSRYDLSPGYGGWQAADATMRSGPSSILAIKRGEIGDNYDLRMTISEVNCDRVVWTLDENKEFHLVKIDTKYIGRCLLTKQPFIYDPHGDTDFQDVMHNYKEPEGSKEERMALYNAIKAFKSEEEWSMAPFHINMPSDEDAEIVFSIEEIESVLFGDILNATVNIKNSSAKTFTIEYCLGAWSMYYNGSTASNIKRETKIIIVKPQSNAVINVPITPEEYASKLVEFTQVKIHYIATVKENHYTWADDSLLSIDMPEIIIDTKEDLETNKEGLIQFQITNCLKCKLTQCNIVFEAPGLGRNVQIACKDIKAGETAIIEHKVKPLLPGEVPIKAIFSSKELSFLCGSSFIQIL